MPTHPTEPAEPAKAWPDAELLQAVAEVDRSLLAWMKSLTLVERLRAAEAMRGLEGLRRVPPQAG
jgi:hypothetical protein